MRLSRIILAFLLFGFLGQILYYYPNLPEKMASHYNGLGQPDGWMPKNGFMIFEAVILLIIIAHFVFLTSIIERLPDSLINMPNKDYWLAKERRDETFGVMHQYFEWFSLGLLGLFIAVNELIFRANLSNRNLSDSIWLALVGFLFFVGVWLTKFILNFRLPK
jgi:uncharacterized membrane protein